jgi:hypothetical protein
MVDPALPHHYHGAAGSRADDAGDDDAGQMLDEDRQSQRDIARIITDAQLRNVWHKATEVAKNTLPFESEEDQYTFTLALDVALNLGVYPTQGFTWCQFPSKALVMPSLSCLS